MSDGEVRSIDDARRVSLVGGARKPILITGGAGFIGSHLADHLARAGEHVLLFDNLARPGVEANLAWLQDRHPTQVSVIVADIRDETALRDAVDAVDAVFHLAAQVAVTTSMSDPASDLQVNLLGTFNLLQALRRRRQPCVFASTNKVYGKLDQVALAATSEAWTPTDTAIARNGVDERQPLDFCTPYGCSKGAADQYVLDYATSFGIPTAVMRMSCIYGPRQLGTEDQGWVAHFVLRALAGEPITIYGDGRQVRDIMFVDDAVAAYLAAWRDIGRLAGRAFNLGGGPANAVSLRQLVGYLGTLLDHAPELSFAPWRPNDQRWYVSDISRAQAALGIAEPLDWRAGVARLVDSYRMAGSPPHAARPPAMPAPKVRSA